MAAASVPIRIEAPCLTVWIKPTPDLRERLEKIVKDAELTKHVFGNDTLIDAVKFILGSEIDKIELSFRPNSQGEQSEGATVLPSAAPGTTAGASLTQGKPVVTYKECKLEHPMFKGKSISELEPEFLSYCLQSFGYALSHNDKLWIEAFLKERPSQPTKPHINYALSEDDVPF